MATFRVNYTGADSLELIINSVIKKFDNVVASEESLTEDEKRLCRHKFEEVFRENIANNVKYIGQPQEGKENGDCPKEVAIVDDAEEHNEYFNTVLYPQINSCVTEVTQKRKNYPLQCCDALRDQYEMQLHDLKRRKLATVANRNCALPDPSDTQHVANDNLLSLVQTAALNLSHFEQNANHLIKKTENLTTVLQQEQQQRKNPISTTTTNDCNHHYLTSKNGTT